MTCLQKVHASASTTTLTSSPILRPRTSRLLHGHSSSAPPGAKIPTGMVTFPGGSRRSGPDSPWRQRRSFVQHLDLGSGDHIITRFTTRTRSLVRAAATDADSLLGLQHQRRPPLQHLLHPGRNSDTTQPRHLHLTYVNYPKTPTPTPGASPPPAAQALNSQPGSEFRPVDMLASADSSSPNHSETFLLRDRTLPGGFWDY